MVHANDFTQGVILHIVAVSPVGRRLRCKWREREKERDRQIERDREMQRGETESQRGSEGE